jgi:Nucleotidyl transferase AbiEii toxin, Type IV TA system
VSLVPRLDALPPAQQALWPELVAVPDPFVLYGGTALALRLAHRTSIDFDFFAHDALDHAALGGSVGFLHGAETLQESPNTLTVLVRRNGAPVKVSFFGAIAFGRVGAPDVTADGVARVASLRDLGGTKIKALLQRVEAKDYVDIAALLAHGVPLAEILAAARALFGAAFNPIVAQKALCYFEGGDLASLDPEVRASLIAEAGRDLELPELPLVSSRLDLSSPGEASR